MTEEEIIRGLNPELAAVIWEAKEITERDIVVVEGKRSREQDNKCRLLGETVGKPDVRIYGNAATIFVYSDGIPCVSRDIYYDLAEAMRFAGENLSTPINWGAARDINGYVDITKWHSTIEELFEATWGDLMSNQEYDILPCFQYFQLHAE
jgi:hypothetical protein